MKIIGYISSTPKEQREQLQPIKQGSAKDKQLI